MIGAFHNHGAAFSGPPDGQRCSDAKHALLRDGLPPKKDEPPEPVEVSFTRLVETTIRVGDVLCCRCCRYPLSEAT